MTSKIALLSFFLFAGEVEARSWVYFDVREPGHQFLLERSPNRSAWFDVVGNAEFCGPEQVYECFKAGDFKFSVPKKFVGNQTQWSFDGVSYVVTGGGRKQILGKKYTAYLIEADLDSQRFRFVFTREMGLIAITTIGASNVVLMLGEGCGFGAPPSCHKPK